MAPQAKHTVIAFIMICGSILDIRTNGISTPSCSIGTYA